MQISYKTRKLEKSLTDPKEISKTYGVMAKKVNQRMKDLLAAATLSVMQTLPAANCHELKGERTGELAVDISGNWRIIFEPAHDLIPVKADGGLDWNSVTQIRILEVVDYH
ncbi:MAG: proteic killer suppression protein [Ignavibacteria bacterium]|nr:MAG: proteic killer suppression protein [Ignavibacteria bacterium]KAF0162480.1 MAG: proteic killer suppression protein [Ignavibacteria bacterium]